MRCGGHRGSTCSTGHYAEAQSLLDELAALADEKDASLFWKATEIAFRGALFALTGNASDAVRAITSGMTSLRSTGATLYEPWHLWHLAMAYAELGQPDDARRCIDDAIDKVERSNEKWCEAEVNRIAGEVALKSPARDTQKAEKYFERALSVAHQQQMKSWELRAAMSMARLWRDQGKVAASARTVGSGLRVVYGGVRHARSEGGEGIARRVGGVRPATQVHWSAREHRPKDQRPRLTPWLCATTVPLFAFSCVSLESPAASLGGLPRGVQNRVRERQEGFFAANQCRRLCNDWPLVAPSLLVLPPVVTRRLASRAD